MHAFDPLTSDLNVRCRAFLSPICQIRWLARDEKSVRTNLHKVILEEGRVATLLHTYAVKSPLVTMVRPKFAPKCTPSRGSIPKPHYLPHPWTRSTYDAKWHPDPICRFATMHWTDRLTDRRTYVRTDRPTDRLRESLTTICRCATRATRPNNTK